MAIPDYQTLMLPSQIPSPLPRVHVSGIKLGKISSGCRQDEAPCRRTLSRKPRKGLLVIK